ncbi:extracellular matrix-binding protein ebh-like [Montipora foliosa]|uniref:extracellular matrix-binding protein ebh-like n=1 Tax=Montipora foliosa TaxID=591990 RepID=UPI0035F16C41
MKEHSVIVLWFLVALLIDVAVTTGTLDQLSVRKQIQQTGARPRSEIDLETEKSVVVCAGQNKSLECFSPGSTIAIQEAFWGRLSSTICPSEDGDPITNCQSDPTTTPIVRNLCDDKEYCEIPASHTVLQPRGIKHCPGVNKYLAVKYTCMPEKHKFVLCNGETTELTCGQGWKIHIMSVYWGRDSPSTCPTPLGKFFTCANSADSVLALKSRCSGKGSCIVTADDQHLSHGGNHCPGMDKYAVISYRCQPHEDASVEDAHSDSEKHPLVSPQHDAINSPLDLTSSSTAPAPQPTMSELNLSMLLPVPQGKASDTLKPIIEFLGEGSQGNLLNNSTSRGENLPIPKDSQPGKTVKSPSQTGNYLSPPPKLTKQTGMLSFSTLQSLIHNNNLGSLMPKSENNVKTTVNPTVVSTKPKESSFDRTQDLVQSFLNSKFGQNLGNSFSSPDLLSDVSYKNLMAKHFESNRRPITSPPTQNPPNKHMIDNLISGLLGQPSSQGTARNSNASSHLRNQNADKILQDDKQSTGDTNKVSSPTVSIGNKIISLDALASALNENSENEDHTQSNLNDADSIIGLTKGSRKQTVKEKHKEKLSQLSRKISTLETLSDALDALTVKLSSEDKPIAKGNAKDQSVPSSVGEENDSGRQSDHHIPNRHHRQYHHQDNVFDEDVEMLGSLLSRRYGHSNSDKKADESYALALADSKNTVHSNEEKSFSSHDLEILQSKVNKAIEMSENMTGKRKATIKPTSKWLPLLLGETRVQDEEAHTREEVATLQGNHSNPGASIRFKNGEVHSLKDILFTLIDNALRTGTLNDLVHRWNRTGSPFTKIAQNVSLFLQGRGILKTPLSRRVNQTATSLVLKPIVTNSSSSSQSSKGIYGLDHSFPADKISFTKAVNNILRVLAKRQGFQTENSTGDSTEYVTTDTLTNFTGVLLGGRIKKNNPQDEFIANLGSQIVEKILRDQAKYSQGVKTTEQEGLLQLNHSTRERNNTVRNDSRRVYDSNLKLAIGKLKFSTYDANNVSKTMRNNTLEDLINSLSIGIGADRKPFPEENKMREKYSKEKPNWSDLMSASTDSFLDKNDADQEGSLQSKNVKFRIDESGDKTLLHRLPSDHKFSDYSLADVVLEAPNDHPDETNSSVKRPAQQLLGSSSSAHAVPRNITSNLNMKNNTSNKNQSDDLGDQTVTFTLETLDDSPPNPLPHNHEQPKEQTVFRSTKVPHQLNVQESNTLGKINATSAKNMEHLFLESDIPALFSKFVTDLKEPNLSKPSVTMPKSPPEVGVTSQTNAFVSKLPLGLEMNAIGRIADSDQKGSVHSIDSSSSTGSDLSVRLGLESAQTKSFKEKVLPVASDLTSTTSANTEGETEIIASKTASSASPVATPSRPTLQRELPTASEVREITTSIKALLKILNSYYKRLRKEDDDNNSDFVGTFPARTQKASVSKGKIQGNLETNQGEMKNVTGKGNHLIHQQEENLKSFMTPPITNLLDKKADNKNPYVDFPQSSPILPTTVDNGGFENIREQPITDETVSSYNWDFRPLQAHAQSPLNSNPTKTSIQPQLGLDWIPGNDVSKVTEDLKDLNFPSVEDDPTLRTVQTIVAEDNMLANEKRKAIRKHEQNRLNENSHQDGKPGISDRNTIPKSKIEGHQPNKSHVDQNVMVSGKNFKRKTNKGGRERNDIPRIAVSDSKNLSRHPKLAIHKIKNQLNVKINGIQNEASKTQTYRQRKNENNREKGRHTEIGGNHKSGGGTNNTLKAAAVMDHNVIKNKNSLNKDLSAMRAKTKN